LNMNHLRSKKMSEKKKKKKKKKKHTDVTVLRPI